MEQTPAQVALLGAALPALIAAAAALLGWGLLCNDHTPATRRPWWVAPPALFLAFVCVLGATEAIHPDLWPKGVPDRKLALGLIALGAGMAHAFAPWRTLGLAASALGGVGAAWVSLGALHPQTLGTTELVATLAATGALTAACVWVYGLGDDAGEWMSPWGLALVAGGAAGVIFLGSLNETALHAGMLACFCLAWGVARMFVPRASMARGGATTMAVLLVGLLTMGRALGLPPAPTLSYALVLVAVAGVGVGALLGRGRRWLVRLVLVVAATGAPLAVGAGLAYTPPRDEGEDGSDGEDDWSEYYENYTEDG